jgi:hypothetical protein
MHPLPACTEFQDKDENDMVTDPQDLSSVSKQLNAKAAQRPGPKPKAGTK